MNSTGWIFLITVIAVIIAGVFHWILCDRKVFYGSWARTISWVAFMVPSVISIQAGLFLLLTKQDPHGDLVYRIQQAIGLGLVAGCIAFFVFKFWRLEHGHRSH